MNYLIQEVKNFLHIKFTSEKLFAVGLGTDEDIERFLIDNRESNFNPCDIAENYVKEQLQAIEIEKILSMEEE